MSSPVTRHTNTFTDIVLGSWASFERHAAFEAARAAESRLFYHSTAFWELHSGSPRIDFTACESLASPRARKRLERWLQTREDQAATNVGQQNTGQQSAANALTRWLGEHTAFPAVFWEEDAPTGNAGIFVAVDKSTSFQHALDAAARHFECSPALLHRAHALRARTETALRPIAIGQFFGREAPKELRIILRPRHANWLRTLPEDLATDAEHLLAALPPQSDVNCALSITADRTALAFEARYTPDSVPNAAWKDWLAVSLPERSALQAEVLAQMFAHDRPIIHADWPAELLLDAFLTNDTTVPQLIVRFSHVKLQRDADGTLRRKLYLRADIAWTQLG